MLDDEDILQIGFALEEGGFTHAQIDTYLEHYGVKGMKWGVRRTIAGKKGAKNTSAENKGYANGITRKPDGDNRTHSRKVRNGKRVGAFLLGGPIGLVAYNVIAKPLSKEEASTGKKATPQSKAAFAGKAVAATLVGGPFGLVAYTQVARQTHQ